MVGVAAEILLNVCPVLLLLMVVQMVQTIQVLTVFMVPRQALLVSMGGKLTPLGGKYVRMAVLLMATGMNVQLVGGRLTLSNNLGGCPKIASS